MFDSYRAKELSEVESVGTFQLKVSGRGKDGTASEWLTITSYELEMIIAVLEPVDYVDTVEAGIRVKLPDFEDLDRRK
jgi:hypothetical protein